MTEIIVPTQTEVPGVELIYLKERDVAGIHFAGLANLLGCATQTVSTATTGTVNFDEVEELEIQTAQGIRTVKFILESGVIKVLKAIRKSKRIKESTREAAEDLYDRFAESGFKLYTMLNAAPEIVKEKVDRHLAIVRPEIDPILGLAEGIKAMRVEQMRLEQSHNELKSEVEELRQAKLKAERELLALPQSSRSVPPETTEMKIRRIVNTYCSVSGAVQGEAWRTLYQQHYYRYQRRVKPLAKESKIKAFIRLGLIDSLYDLALELFKPSSETSVK